MVIEIGNYYVCETNQNGIHEMYIVRVLPPKEWSPEEMHVTETLAVHADMAMWNNDWLDSYLTRAATTEEIMLFDAEREKNISKLLSFGEVVTTGFIS